MMLRPQAGLLALFIVFAGCQGTDETQGDPRTTIVAPGTGPTNTAPLWPLRAGTYVSNAGNPNLVLDPVEMAGRRVLPYVAIGDPNADFRRWQYLSPSPEGIYLLGTLRDGLYPRPVLAVPSEVRDGMKWQVDVGDGADPVSCSALRKPSAEDGTIGPIDHWQVGCNRLWAFTDPGVNVNFGWTLAEGHGPASYGDIILPLDDPPSAPQATLPAITLQPLNGGKPFVAGQGTRVSALVNPAHDGSAIRLIVDGLSASFSNGGMVSGFGTGSFRACSLFDGATFREPKDPDEFIGPRGEKLDQFAHTCTDPDQTVIRPDGQLDTFVGDERCTGGPKFVGDPTPLVCTDKIAGVFPGGARTQGYVENGGAVGDLHLPTDPTKPAIDNPRNLGGDLFFAARGVGGDRGSVGYSPLMSIYSDSGLQRIGIQFRPPWPLHSATLEADTIRNVQPEMYPFAISTVRTVDGRSDLHILPDGRIERMHYGEAGLRLEPMGQVALPKRHWLVGAIEWNGKLLVFTQGDYHGFDTELVRTTHLDSNGVEQPAVEMDNHIKPDFGNVYAWSADLPAASAPIEIPPVRRALTRRAIGDDVLLCTTPGQPISRSGWGLYGKKNDPAAWGRVNPSNGQLISPAVPPTLSAAATVLPGGPGCIEIVRDPVPAPKVPVGETWGPARSWNTVVGPIPGLGRTLIGTGAPPPVSRLAGGPLAALAGGGFVTVGVNYGPYGFATGPNRAEWWTNPKTVHPDAAGHGMWLRGENELNCATPMVGCWGWVLLGDSVKKFEQSGPFNAANMPIGTAVQGGGLLLPDSVFLPDGTSRKHPTAIAPPPGTKLLPSGALADTTVCGQLTQSGAAKPDSVYCVSPTGNLRTKKFQNSGPFPFDSPWEVSPDGVFYATDGTAGGRLDPATLIATSIGKVTTFAHDGAGNLYGAAADTIYRMDAAGPVPIKLTSPLPGAEFWITVDPDAFYVFSGVSVQVIPRQ